jgi:polyisoprenoid-binding protein YceI
MPVIGARVTVGANGRPAGIHAEVDASAIDTGNPRRDNDLRGRRFLGVGKWPTIAFEASQIVAGDTGWTVDGTLTVKDTRSHVHLEVTRHDAASESIECVDLTATTQFDRRLAGVTGGQAVLVGHQISVSLTVRLCPPKAS